MQTGTQPTAFNSGHKPTRTNSLMSFQSAVDSSFVPLRVSAPRSDSFFANLNALQADQVTFTQIDASPHQVDRTPEMISAGGTGLYKVTMLLSGSNLLIQDGKELVMRPGDLAVYDTSRPYSLIFDEEVSLLVMMFDKALLNLPSKFTDQLTAVSLTAEHPDLARVTGSFISQFPQALEPLSNRLRGKLAHTSIELLSTLFSGILDSDPGSLDHRQHLLQRIFGYIDDNLNDASLSPGQIAAAHYISVRYLHGIFKTTGTTVAQWIKDRRLDNSRADLMDQSLDQTPVALIAARWGFQDPAHFSRAFKAKFGYSPTEARGGFIFEK